MKIKLAMCALVTVGMVFSASGMNRWRALSMLETGDNDYAVGHCGEISRFQILPRLWPGGNPHNPQAALMVARRIMHVRVERFVETHKHQPTPFQFYVLWNAPAEVDHPMPCVAERARRFANLVERDEHSSQATAQAFNFPRKTTHTS
jgi:hypothetical protein